MKSQFIATYTTDELTPLLGYRDRRNVLIRANRENWESRPRQGRGGGHEWLVSSMPKPTRELIMAGMLRQGLQGAEICEAIGTDFNAKPLKASFLHQNSTKIAENNTSFAFRGASARDKAIANARLLFVQEVARLSLIGGREKAIQHICTGSALGTLAEPLASSVKAALAKEGSEISRRTLYRWLKSYEAQSIDGLLPRQGVKKPAPDWLDTFLRHYQKPQNPTVQHAYDCFVREYGADAPSIHMVRRQLSKMSAVARENGRATGNALLKLRPYKRRDTSELWPTDVYTADGTTLDAEMIHPLHGQPCKAEITAILDVATRRCVGFSMSFAESSLGVLDALRSACIFGGVPALFYTDNGPGYTNALMKDDKTGIFQRLGITGTTSIPGRPQGKGLMERGVKTLWVRAAQGLASYTGSMMDEDTAHKNFRASRKALNEGKRSILPLWHEARAHLLERIDEYNNTPHRGLPRYRDNAGRQVHYTPNEYWATFEKRGFRKVKVPAGMESELFMPGVMRAVRNGYVRLFGGMYFDDELAFWHGREIEVRYSVFDMAKVGCFDKKGSFICTAELDANSIPYFPKSVVEIAKEKREKAQVKRIGQKLERIIPGARVSLPEKPQEFSDFAEITGDPQQTALAVEEIRQVMDAEAPAKTQEKRPVIFETRLKRYCWLMTHKESLIEGDEAFIAEFRNSDEYADMKDWLDIQGIA